jgi:flagellar basal body-associated protein FliL
MDYFPDEQKKSKKPLIIGGLIAVAVLLIGTALFFFWQNKGPSANPSVRVPLSASNTNNQNGNTPTSKTPSNSIERALTTDEKTQYRFPVNADVWMRTTVPTDGTKPVTVFFLGSNKGK